MYAVKNISDYLKIIEDNDLTKYYSRGESKQYKTPLLASGLRNSNICFDALLTNYKNEVIHTLNDIQIEHFIAFAQHHGIPTNLLDFTDSHLVSLYFACLDSHKQDGYIYFLDTHRTINLETLYPNRINADSVTNQLYNFNTDIVSTVLMSISHASLFHQNEYITWTCSLLSRLSESLKQEDLKNRNDLLSCATNLCAFIKNHPKNPLLNSKSLKLYENIFKVIFTISNTPGYHVHSLIENFEKLQKRDIWLRAKTKYHVAVIILLISTLRHINFSNHDFVNAPYYFIYKPPNATQRIQSQNSVFINQLYWYGTNQIIQPDTIVKVESSYKTSVLKELECLGVNRKTIFGDYDNIAKYIIETYDDNAYIIEECKS